MQQRSIGPNSIKLLSWYRVVDRFKQAYPSFQPAPPAELDHSLRRIHAQYFHAFFLKIRSVVPWSATGVQYSLPWQCRQKPIGKTLEIDGKILPELSLKILGVLIVDGHGGRSIVRVHAAESNNTADV